MQAPKFPEPRAQIALPSVAPPPAGASYNPAVDAHAALLRAAHEVEAQKLAKGDPTAALKAKMERATAPAPQVGVPLGMTVGEGEVDAEEEVVVGDESVVAPRASARKTKQQRDKAARVLAEVRLCYSTSVVPADDVLQKRERLQKVANRRMLADVLAAKALRTATLRSKASRAQTLAARDARAQERLAAGLAGRKLGRHVVQANPVDVQLGEDLSESLRGLKVRQLSGSRARCGWLMRRLSSAGRKCVPRPVLVDAAARTG
jgi:nucleolar protein 53